MPDSKRILVTGPPLNGRDDYIQAAREGREDNIGYHHVFSKMQEIGTRFDLPNLTRENVLNVSDSKLTELRKEAIEDEIQADILSSDKEIEIVSSPAMFYTDPQPENPRGIINALTLENIKSLSPDLIVIFISDLLEVKQNLEQDDVWSERANSALSNLAQWRADSIELIYDFRESLLSEGKGPLDVIIFASGHSHSNFLKLIKKEVPRIYLSFAITGASGDDLQEVERIKHKLKDKFACLDPYKIKDWDIIEGYDDAQEENKDKVEFENYDDPVDLDEIKDAIESIRAQTVDRDYKLIQRSHATVVLHITDRPSNGVMSEIIRTNTKGNNPVYVLYPFERRPSPFFEFYVNDEERIIRNNKDINEMTTDLITKMEEDIQNEQWSRWSPTS